MDLVSVGTGLGGLVLGALLGVWLGEFVKRPRLRITGSGGGGVPYSVGYLILSNEPSLFGIRLGRTMIFGKSIHPATQWGLVLERHAAECTADISDADNPRLGGVGLVFQVEGVATPQPNARIQSGKSASLYLFARRIDQGKHYFIYAPKSEVDRDPRLPPEDAMFEGARRFILTIHYSGRTLRLPMSVTRSVDGHLMVQTPKGSTSF